MARKVNPRTASRTSAKQKKQSASVSAATIVTTYKYQILYLKDVHFYMGSATERAKRIKYCQQEKFNGVIMYGVDGIISQQPYWPALRSYINELIAAGVKYVGLAYSNSTVVTFLNLFQDGTDPSKNFTFGISEMEPWNNAMTWDEYISRIASFRAWANTETDYVEAWTYQGWINKPTGTDANSNAKRTLQSINKATLHIYTYPEPHPSYVTAGNRIQIYGQEALNLGFTKDRKMPMLFIFSAEQAFSQTGFKTKTAAAYTADVIKYIDGLTFVGRECLDYKQGFLVFKDTDYMVSRPLI